MAYYPVRDRTGPDHHLRREIRQSCASRARYPVRHRSPAMTADKTTVTVRVAVDRVLASARCRVRTTGRTTGQAYGQ